jgi:hypothetical protein
VTQASINVPQTAAFARRLVCRALTVLGGVAAGTALAWWLSSTAASADTVEAPAVDVPAAVAQFAAPVTEPARDTFDTVVRQLQDPSPPPKLGDLGQKVKDAAEQFRAKADDHLPKPPTCGTPVCLGNERHVYPFDAFGRADLPPAPAHVPAATTVPPAVAVDVIDALVPNTAKERAFADGMSRRGSPAPAQPANPGQPNWPAPLPFAPCGIPTTGNHGSAGNAADSHLFAVLPWHDRNLDTVAGGIAAATDAATFGRPGSQPGVAPD